MENRKWIRLPVLPESFPLSTDTVMLADFAELHGRESVCDLGSGIGTLAMILAASWPDCRFTGFELQPDVAALAANVISENGLTRQVAVLQADLRRPDTLGPAGRFDSAVSNPPYFPAAAGFRSSDPHKLAARSEAFCSMQELCRAAAYLLKYGGSFSLVHKPERLADLCCCLRDNGLEPKKLRFVKNTAGSAPSLLLLTAKKGGHAGLRVLPDLVLKEADGSNTEEFQRIYGIKGEPL